jgi:hypothetical protein
MSPWSQRWLSGTKRDRKSAAVIEPANPPEPALLMSAILESSMAR